jgi:catechol 2,3-dioxygenase-like lactoylglutathione lyase family enzyme
MNMPNCLTSLPVPVIDHVVVMVRDRLVEAANVYARLGFALTAEGRHTLGSVNHLAMFGPNYLELLGVPAGTAGRPGLLEAPAGLGALAFATDDAASVHDALAAAGVAVEPLLEFARPVALAEGARQAAFRVAGLAPGTTDAGWLFFCQHMTRDVVWRDEWRRHPNGVLGVAGVVIAAARPEALAALFGRMFGAEALVMVPGGVRLLAGLSSIDVVAPAELERRYGAAAPPREGREAIMAALVLRVAERDRTAAVLRAGGVAGLRETGASLVVPASEAFGATLEFRAA